LGYLGYDLLVEFCLLVVSHQPRSPRGGWRARRAGWRGSLRTTLDVTVPLKRLVVLPQAAGPGGTHTAAARHDHSARVTNGLVTNVGHVSKRGVTPHGLLNRTPSAPSSSRASPLSHPRLPGGSYAPGVRRGYVHTVRGSTRSSETMRRYRRPLRSCP